VWENKRKEKKEKNRRKKEIGEIKKFADDGWMW
jgi:hypothetical protein